MNQQSYQVGPSQYQPAMPQYSLPATNTVPIAIPINPIAQPTMYDGQMPRMSTNGYPIAQGDVNGQAISNLPEAPLGNQPIYEYDAQETYDLTFMCFKCRISSNGFTLPATYFIFLTFSLITSSTTLLHCPHCHNYVLTKLQPPKFMYWYLVIFNIYFNI